MADNTKDNRQRRGEGPPERQGGLLRSVLLFLLVLGVVCGVVFAAAWRDGTGFDAILRRLSYGSAQSSGGAGFTYDAAGDNRFALVGDGMAVLSGTEFQVLDGDGQRVYSVKVNMDSPALAAGGGRVCAYDVGGTELYVAGPAGELFRLEADEAEPYISATLNGKGWLAVTAEKKGYKGSVHVYDAGGVDVFEFKSSSRFVTAGRVTEDCKALAAVTLGQSGGVFVSNVGFYELGRDAKEPQASYDIRDGLVLELCQKGTSLAALADTGLSFGSRSGELEAEYRFDGQYLREYTLSGDGFSALLLNRYQSGSVGRLVTVGDGGAEIASLDIREEVLSLSAAGRYLAVLYTDKLIIYNRELQPYATLAGTGSARAALAREDGSALAAGADAARLFLP